MGKDEPRARIEGRDRLPAARLGSRTYLDTLGFNLVGYGCTTCIGNSGPLPDEIAAEVRERQLVVCSVLSGNRNFEGRIQQDVRANYLASPPLVVAYALAGSLNVDMTHGTARHGGRRGARVSQGHLAGRAGNSAHDARRGLGRDVPAQYDEGVRGRRAVAESAGPTGDRFAWEQRSRRTSAQPPFLENLSREPAPPAEIRGRARAGAARRQHHDRSHLAGRIDQA